MSILLDEKRISKAIGDYLWNTENPDDDFYYDEKKFVNHFKAIAKAQLRKVLDELKKPCPHQDGTGPAVDCSLCCWELFEEIVKKLE